MTPPAELREALLAAVNPLPTLDGGTAIVLATASSPPAITLLSTGDVVVDNDKVRLAVFATNSAIDQLGGSCTLLVPTDRSVLRVYLQPASVRRTGLLAVIEGSIVSLRPSSEPPWSLRLDFEPAQEQGRDAFVEYWRQVRSWLEQGAPGEGPQSPTTHPAA